MWRRGNSLITCNTAQPGFHKICTRGPENGEQGLERGLTLGFWVLPSTKFFDPSTLSMRKGSDGEEIENNDVSSGH